MRGHSVPGTRQQSLPPSTRRDQRLATWVDELAEPAAATVSSVIRRSVEDANSEWTCQICSQGKIPPQQSSCPTCRRARGTELRRDYLTTNELTQSVVDAVNEGADGTSSSRPKRREKSPARQVAAPGAC